MIMPAPPLHLPLFWAQSALSAPIPLYPYLSCLPCQFTSIIFPLFWSVQEDFFPRFCRYLPSISFDAFGARHISLLSIPILFQHRRFMSHLSLSDYDLTFQRLLVLDIKTASSYLSTDQNKPTRTKGKVSRPLSVWDPSCSLLCDYASVL